MAIPIPQQDNIPVPNKDLAMNNSDSENDDSSSEFDYEAHLMEMDEIRESILPMKWKKIIDFQLALNYIELADRRGHNFASLNAGQEFDNLLNDIGIVSNGLTMTWEKLDCPFFTLAYDILHVVKFWHCDLEMNTHRTQWFCDFDCPLDVNRQHLFKICQFLVGCGIKIGYQSTENRAIPRINLYMSGQSWEDPIDKLCTIDQLVAV